MPTQSTSAPHAPSMISSATTNRRTMLQAAAVAAGAVGLPAGALLAASPVLAQDDATATAAIAPSCVLTPELTEGPYYLDVDLIRQDITEGRPGLPLRLSVLVTDSTTCQPLPNAAVDIWHCDSHGYYSGVSANSPGSDVNTDQVADAAASTFLRGIQMTNAEGIAEFGTIYPGWYVSRTVHIHLKVHVGGENDAGVYEGGNVVHTGQLFFDDTVSDAVFLTEAYAGRPEDERTFNDEDNIRGDHDDEPGFLVATTQLDPDDLLAGLTGTITIGVDPTAEPAAAGMGGGDRPQGGPDGSPPSGPPPDGERPGAPPTDEESTPPSA